jgi:hypothetical protein
MVLDAKSGHVLGTAGAFAYAPNDAYAIEVPILGDTASPVDGTASVSTVVFLEPLVRREVTRVPNEEPQEYFEFGAAICPNAATFAVSFATTELAVYRARDGRKLASIPTPGNGSPVFSRSGRFVALQLHRSEVMTMALFELVP